jgi:hypothetical protein
MKRRLHAKNGKSVRPGWYEASSENALIVQTDRSLMASLPAHPLWWLDFFYELVFVVNPFIQC